ncbi:MAG: hypothetical protein AB7O67_01935 [Vicinamibacterales bacterium]
MFIPFRRTQPRDLDGIERLPIGRDAREALTDLIERRRDAGAAENRTRHAALAAQLETARQPIPEALQAAVDKAQAAVDRTRQAYDAAVRTLRVRVSEREMAQHERRRHVALLERELQACADPRIDEARQRIDATADWLRSHGLWQQPRGAKHPAGVERGASAPAEVTVDNSRELDAVLRCVPVARQQLDALKLAEVDDLDAAIAAIERGIGFAAVLPAGWDDGEPPTT